MADEIEAGMCDVLVGMCDVCFLLDGDSRLRPVFWCNSCDAWLCDTCVGDPWRRARAGWKRAVRRLIGVTSALCLLAAFGGIAHGQIYDLACPSGTTVLEKTSVPATNHFRAYICVDAFGVVTSPVFASAVSGPGLPSNSIQANNGGTFTGVPGTAVNFTASGPTISSVGDVNNNDLARWYAKGKTGNFFGISVSPYGDTQGLQFTLLDAAANSNFVSPSLINMNGALSAYANLSPGASNFDNLILRPGAQQTLVGLTVIGDTNSSHIQNWFPSGAGTPVFFVGANGNPNITGCVSGTVIAADGTGCTPLPTNISLISGNNSRLDITGIVTVYPYGPSGHGTGIEFLGSQGANNGSIDGTAASLLTNYAFSDGPLNISTFTSRVTPNLHINTDGSVGFGGTTSDAGISRLGAASLAVGNGTASDYSGSLKLTGLNNQGASSSLSVAGAVPAAVATNTQNDSGTPDYAETSVGLCPNLGNHDCNITVGQSLTPANAVSFSFNYSGDNSAFNFGSIGVFGVGTVFKFDKTLNVYLPRLSTASDTRPICPNGVNGALTISGCGVQGTISTGPGLFGALSVDTVLATTVVAYAGHFTSITATTSLGGTCTTVPEFNVFVGTSDTGNAVSASATTQTKGTSTTQAETLPFSNGDQIGIYISTAGATCVANSFVVSAQYVR